jgi:hypothetical protein
MPSTKQLENEFPHDLDQNQSSEDGAEFLPNRSFLVGCFPVEPQVMFTDGRASQEPDKGARAFFSRKIFARWEGDAGAATSL